MTTNEVLKWLERRGSKRVVQGMARYGIPSEGAFGVPMGALQKLAKQLGTDHELSLALWQSGCCEARLLAALVGDPKRVTRRQMDAWAKGFQNWGDCDTVCFKRFLPWIEKGAADGRNFVAKGVSWALRAIGGRSPALHEASTATAERLAQARDAARRWVGKDALRELQNPKLRARLARRGAGAPQNERR